MGFWDRLSRRSSNDEIDDDDRPTKKNAFSSSSSSSPAFQKLQDYIPESAFSLPSTHRSGEYKRAFQGLFPKETVDFVVDFSNSWSSPQLITLGICSLGTLGLGVVIGRKGATSLQRVTSAHALSNVGPESSYLKGRVVSVSDGDTFRLYHIPTLFHSTKLASDAKLSEETIPIRICTIDTPEVAKFGKPSQPFGEEAKEHLSSYILNRNVQVQVLQRDQYGRAVAHVQVPRWGYWLLGRHYAMDEIMLKAGLAEVYTGGGAVYGPKGKEYYISLMEAAQSKKKGMWSLKNRESAAEYKARMKEG